MIASNRKVVAQTWAKCHELPDATSYQTVDPKPNMIANRIQIQRRGPTTR